MAGAVAVVVVVAVVAVVFVTDVVAADVAAGAVSFVFTGAAGMQALSESAANKIEMAKGK